MKNTRLCLVTILRDYSIYDFRMRIVQFSYKLLQKVTMQSYRTCNHVSARCSCAFWSPCTFQYEETTVDTAV